MPLQQIEKDILYRTYLWPLKTVCRIIAVIGASVSALFYFGARARGNVDWLTFFITAILTGFFIALILHTCFADFYNPKKYIAMEGIFIYKKSYRYKGRCCYFVYIKADDGRYYRADSHELYTALDDHVVYTHQRDKKDIRLRYFVQKDAKANGIAIPNIGNIVYRNGVYIRESDKFLAQ